jgi:flavin-dependent dehydrogenase
MSEPNAGGSSYDVVILGGGLAGLTLALQLKRLRPETSVFVAEKRTDEAPGATFKVGESLVESGAYYYSTVCGLKDHLETAQQKKHGLRFFFPAGDNSEIARRVEWGGYDWPVVDICQLDRGTFENEILHRARAAGAEISMGSFVDAVELGADGERHMVTVVRGGPGGERSTVDGRWLVDASGRASIVKRKLGLARDNGHHINSAWFRLDGGMDLEDWTTDEVWLNRMPERGLRRFSTNHLCGEGYWVWLIQLATGPISIGVCADPRFHPYDRIKTFDSLLDWFREHEPQLAAAVEARRDQLLDFLTIEDYSYTCDRVYSTDRWCLTGEAGTFADPLYSPGSDFIGYGNRFIGDLIVRDLDDEDVQNRTEFFNFLYFQLFTPIMSVYRDQYPLLGNPQVAVAKITFDHFCYFATLPFLQMHSMLIRPEVMFDLVDYVTGRVIPLLQNVQAFFPQWHELDQRDWQGVSVLNDKFTPMHDVQAYLLAEFDDDEALKARFRANVELIEALAVVMFHWAARVLPEQPGEDVRINPRAISLHPERWEEDGLYTEPGLSLAEARQMLPGVDEYLLETYAEAVPQ